MALAELRPAIGLMKVDHDVGRVGHAELPEAPKAGTDKPAGGDTTRLWAAFVLSGTGD